MSAPEALNYGWHRAPGRRCRCLTPVGTQCSAAATQEDFLCDPCRDRTTEWGSDGLHWCRSSSTPRVSAPASTPSGKGTSLADEGSE